MQRCHDAADSRNTVRLTDYCSMPLRLQQAEENSPSQKQHEKPPCFVDIPVASDSAEATAATGKAATALPCLSTAADDCQALCASSSRRADGSVIADCCALRRALEDTSPVISCMSIICEGVTVQIQKACAAALTSALCAC
ncbi:hypothetical protein cyc_09271 [Cyclospora cayetanensis]|uniref:Uncharacterized protein n=1 Tax=Cyclospora cayetanensis TaxID=88456 RepID=A0A1D3CWM9_9EIME|nr:hypothetical protein cyc_09271 [Cyclospora cayetanensis]